MFAIMRTKKIKTLGSVASSLAHCYRERDTPNADPSRAELNKHIVGGSVDSSMGLLRERLPEKKRKDAVVAIEYLFAASPEFFEKATMREKTEFFRASTQWLVDKHGKENVIAASIHNDELNPHMSVFVVPVTKDGRLSAKDFLGGRQLLRDAQTSYAEAVKHLGLKRGIEGSKAHHEAPKRFYTYLKTEVEPTHDIEVPPPSPVDRLKVADYGKKVADAVIDQVTPELVALREKIKTVEPIKTAFKRLEKNLMAKSPEAEKIEQSLNGLDWQAKKQLLELVEKTSANMRAEKLALGKKRDIELIEKLKNRGRGLER